MVIKEIKNIKSGKNELRKFGITMGIFLCLLGGLFLFRKKECYFYFFMVSPVFFFLGSFLPVLLKPVHKVWMSLAIILGWLMTRLILSILFYAVFTPIGLVTRLLGKKFLDIEFTRDASSYWIPNKTVKFEKKNYERQF